MGMSGLAQLAKWRGDEVSGSDRYFDRGEAASVRAALERVGVRIVPQDGSGLGGAELAVTSAAVESLIPDIAEARRRGVELLTRWEFLERLTRGKDALVVAGTNGKSTTTALLGWVLEECGFDPSLVLGAPLRGERAGWGNARLGKSEWFCLEADESDGGLTHYRPYLGIVTNVSPDHFETERLKELFGEFIGNCRGGLVRNADCRLSRKLPPGPGRTVTFSVESPSDFRARDLRLERDRSFFEAGGERFELPLSGLHNVYNALAAIAAASFLEVPPARISAALRTFPGLKRRLEVISARDGMTVIDDYAHNPAKVSAALAAARLQGERVIAVYQPHGFAPLQRFLRRLADAFSRGLRPGDRLLILPVYYVGGTAPKGIGPDDLRRAIETKAEVRVCHGRPEALSDISGSARPGDVVLVMGARDPTLSDLAVEIGRELAAKMLPLPRPPFLTTPACRQAGINTD